MLTRAGLLRAKNFIRLTYSTIMVIRIVITCTTGESSFYNAIKTFWVFENSQFRKVCELFISGNLDWKEKNVGLKNEG